MMQRTKFIASLILGALVASTAMANSIAETGRRLLEENKKAVVTIRVVIETQVSGPGFGSDRRENTAEITGTVISPDGLIVTSLSQTDPASLMRGMGASRSPDFRVESTLTDIQVMMDDGSELSAEEVLRDADLDLSFLRLLEVPEEPIAYIDLNSGATAQLLDNAFVLNRLGRVASRTYSISVETVEAIVERPRTFYIPGTQETRTGLGSPAFTTEGKPLGLILVRTISASSGGFQSAGRQDSMTPVILPGRDILEAAEQVPPRAEDEDDAEEEEAEEADDAEDVAEADEAEEAEAE